MEVNAIKDGNGNVVITEDSFEMLLACLDNQKFIGESPQNGDSLSVGEGNYWKGQEDIQNTIDSYNTECRKILHQKYIFETKQDGYYLTKKYEHQNEITPWSGEDVGLVYELFKDTRITYKQREDLSSLDGSEEFTQKDNPTGEIKDERFAIEPEPRTWHIERPLMYDGDYLTVSEDGIQNRPWKREEIEKIKKIFS
jgi:hypothetical protein